LFKFSVFGGLTKVHLAPCHLHATRCQKHELCCSEALTDGYWLKPQHQPDIYQYLISHIYVSAYNLHVFLGWCSHFLKEIYGLMLVWHYLLCQMHSLCV
jgi:hypothetical protein